MNIQELIEGYEKTRATHMADVEQNRLNTIEAGKAAVVTLAKKYLGDLWDQLTPEAVECRHEPGNIKMGFLIPVFWGKSGLIRQDFNTRNNIWDDMYLDFGYSSGNGMRVTLPAPDEAFGELFTQVKAHVEDMIQQEKARAAYELKAFMDFEGLGEEGVQKKLKRAITAFPDHESEFTENANAQLKVLADFVEKRLIEQLAYELKQSELEQLKLLVDYAWRGPFTVYKVTYGAKMEGSEDGDIGVYTNCFYTLMSEEPYMSHDRGYWYAFEAGEYKKRIKPKNFISIETLIIEKAGDAPDELKRWITLQSKNLTDVSIFTYFPPFALFAFDYDELRVAVEAQQELEISDASQEDLS